jgi:TAP-like protein
MTRSPGRTSRGSWPTSRGRPTPRRWAHACGRSGSAPRTSQSAASRTTRTSSRGSRRSRARTPTTQTRTLLGRERARRPTLSSAIFGRIWTWASSICADWPRADQDRYTGPCDGHTANPVLVIGNRFDPATRYEGAVTVANLLPDSRLLTLHGWGHASLFLSRCADELASRYLVDLVLPSPGTVCEQDHVPFTSPWPPRRRSLSAIRRAPPPDHRRRQTRRRVVRPPRGTSGRARRPSRLRRRLRQLV